MPRRRFALGLALVVAGCGRGGETTAETDMAHAPKMLSLQRLPPRDGARLAVSSEAVGADGAIAPRYSAYGDNVSPALAWTPVPGAAAYALIVEDPDAPSASPFVHWLIWNIGAAQLPEGVARGARPAGAVQGRNGIGAPGYFGPRPPAGTGLHHYHFQVFAVDAPLRLAGGADLSALIEAMRGHVLAEGELVGTFAAPS